MGRDDDDLMNNENPNDDFEFDDSADDNLSIPDTPYGQDELEGDDDLLGTADGDFDLGEGLGDSFGDDADLDDLAGLERSDSVRGEDVEEIDEVQEAEEEQGALDDDEPEPFSLGWKSYLGIGLAATLTVGGLAMVMFGGGSEPSQPRQAMSPEQLQEIAARSNGPSEGGGQPQSGSPSMTNSQAGTPQNSSQQSQGNRTSEDEFRNFDPNDPVITSPDRQTVDRVIPGESDILELVESEFVQINDFKALRGTVNNQGRRLSRIQDDLTDTQGSLSALEKRVAELEKTGPELAPAGAQGSGEPDAANDGDAQNKPSEEVREAQIRLKAFNYRPGPIDGLMGGRTEAAIKRFQKQHGIAVTGNLDNQTLEMLSDAPQAYAGRYETKKRTEITSNSARDHQESWYVRGVTSARAIIYKADGRSYAVSEGTEVPGFGQVTRLDPSKHQVVTTKGTIGLK